MRNNISAAKGASRRNKNLNVRFSSGRSGQKRELACRIIHRFRSMNIAVEAADSKSGHLLGPSGGAATLLATLFYQS